MDIAQFYNRISRIYYFLQDDLSKRIFAKRLLYNSTGEKHFIDTMIKEDVSEFGGDGMYDPEMSSVKLQEFKDRIGAKKVIIYGAGYIGKELLTLFQQDEVVAFCDKKAEKEEYLFMSIPVIPIRKAIEYNDVVYLLGSWRYRTEMKEELIKYGISENAIISAPSDLVLNCSLHQYFDDDIIRLSKDEVFVDCGAFQLETTLEFVKKCQGQYDSVYVFEPDPNNYDTIQKNIREKNLFNVYTYPLGVWENTTTMHFWSSMDSSAITEQGELQVEVTSIDEVLNGRRATFIKMDVEGSELKALHGAEATIKKYRPKLAISLYHKREDLLEIPEYIKSIVPEYKLYIRHYSNYVVETVLYAVID